MTSVDFFFQWPRVQTSDSISKHINVMTISNQRLQISIAYKILQSLIAVFCKQLRNQIVENKSVLYSSSWFSFHKVYSWKYYYTLWVGCLTIAEYPSAFPRVSLSYCWYSFTCIPLGEESEVSCLGLKHICQVKALPQTSWHGSSACWTLSYVHFVLSTTWMTKLFTLSLFRFRYRFYVMHYTEKRLQTCLFTYHI